MPIVLTPYWSNGVQKLKVAPKPPPKPAHGLTPPALDENVHRQRCLQQLRSKDKSIEKYIYLSQLKDADANMFYKICLNNMSEITPLIYTPTVGDACLQYSHIFRRPEGLFISYKDKGSIGKVIRNWPRIEEARISVVTDGSRILGLGDLGVNGMPIAIGKLSLYVAGAGIRPSSTVPICIDVGTDNKKFLEDPLYLGLRQPRISEAEMMEFMEEFMHEMSVVFPNLLIQFEDFSTDKAFSFLSTFRNRYPLFNDDIQGTGAVVLSGFMNAAKLSSAASGRPLTDHKILFLGAGSAGVGVGMQLMSFFKLQGMSEEQARERIYLVDSQGLIYDGRGPMAEHKKYFSRKDYNGPPMKNLVDIIDYVKPTALLGLSTIKSAFNQPVIELMSALNPRPIIFPLSNPVRLSECEFTEAVEWSNGKVIFASGSPFPEQQHKGRTLYPGQGNNMYVFPGIGLGAILSQRGLELVYPRIERIRDISGQIALSVVRAAQKEGVDRSTDLRGLDDAALLRHIKGKMWNP